MCFIKSEKLKVNAVIAAQKSAIWSADKVALNQRWLQIKIQIAILNAKYKTLEVINLEKALFC